MRMFPVSPHVKHMVCKDFMPKGCKMVQKGHRFSGYADEAGWEIYLFWKKMPVLGIEVLCVR